MLKQAVLMRPKKLALWRIILSILALTAIHTKYTNAGEFKETHSNFIVVKDKLVSDNCPVCETRLLVLPMRCPQGKINCISEHRCYYCRVCEVFFEKEKQVL